MRFVNGLALVCLVLLGASAALAADQVIALGNDSSEITLVSRSENSLHFRVQLGELRCLDVQTPEGSFTRLMIPGFHASQVQGSPELPMMNRLIEIPLGATARVEILDTQSRQIDLAQLGVTNWLMPTQPSMPKSATPEEWPFVFHPESYAVAEVAQDLVRIESLGQLRAVSLGRVEVSPVAYQPQQNKLLVHESVEFRVEFSGGDPAREAEVKARTHSSFFDPIYDQITGFRGLHDSYPDRVGDVVTLVVITPPEFEYQLADYVAWKQERGFRTVVGVIGSGEVGTTKESIRDYIHDLYDNATPELPAPSFVVFVGDIAQTPTWTEGGDATDRPYCAVDGDLVPDIFYGRLSATNSTMLQNILDKTLMYDQYAMPDPSYLEKAVMIAGMDSGYGSTHGNGQINYGTTYYFNAAHNIDPFVYLYPQSGSNASNIVQNVSDGVSYINYTAHGSQTSWSDPYFSQSNINGLQNNGEYCLAVGNCCLTSSYEYSECFAETWLRAPNKGAIGYIGASNSTYWDEDFWWGVGSGSVSANPTFETHGMGAYDGVFHDHGEAMTQWYVTNDALIFSGNLAVMEAGSSLIGYYWTIYNLMGDPSLSTWIGTPQANPVSHPAALMSSESSLTLQAVPNSYCGLTLDGVQVGAGTVGASGQLEIDFWQPLDPGDLHLVVMAQFREPYVVDIPVLPPEGPFLTFADCSVLDSSGDDDGALDEGEAVGMNLTLENSGVEIATGVAATLATTDPFVTVVDAYQAFGNIQAGSSGTCSSPFTLEVAGDIPDEHTVNFTVQITSAEGSWDSGFSLGAEAPVLATGALSINDVAGGNGSGNADAGETFYLQIQLQNTGHSAADNLSGTLTCSDGYVTIPGDAGQCGEVSIGGDGLLGMFQVAVSPDCPEPTHLPFHLVLSCSSGFSAEFDFEMPVGGWFDHMENDHGWTVGASGDNASSGIWVRADPVGTEYNSIVVQMENDHTPDPATLCFVTGNGSPGGTAGAADVDGGKTTLLTPVFHLGGALSAQVSYYRWYTNNAGNNPGEDWWDVAVTSNGTDWVSLEHTQATDASWTQYSFELTDYVTLTDNVQIRFVASDEGAGSLVEAGVDDFLMTVVQPVTTAVGDEQAGVPAVLAFGKSYPNPFNPKTTLQFDLPRAGEVQVGIYDISGRKVATLLQGHFGAGQHQVSWLGRDDTGRQVASGQYFAVLNADGLTVTQKLVLLK